jgi:hypothetical protein
MFLVGYLGLPTGPSRPYFRVCVSEAVFLSTATSKVVLIKLTTGVCISGLVEW